MILRQSSIPTALALIVLWVPGLANATEELRVQITVLAKHVLDVVKQQPVAVGSFTPIGQPHSNTGPGLESELTVALNNLTPAIVSVTARFEVKGDYGFHTSKDPKHDGLKIVKIKARVLDRESGETLSDTPIEAVLTGTNSIGKIIQPTVHLPLEGTKKERNQLLDQATKHPQVIIDGVKVKSSAQSPYSVEILAKPKTSTSALEIRQPRSEQGMAFVDLALEDVYAVRVTNNTEELTAVALTIDGIDMYYFSQDRNEKNQPKFSHTVFPPHGSDTIVGWHNQLEGKDNYLSFLVTEYGKGAVTKAGITARGNVGVIHVQFAKCKLLPDDKSPRAGNETGFGPPVEKKQKAVRVEIDPPHDFVSIRYTRPQ